MWLPGICWAGVGYTIHFTWLGLGTAWSCDLGNKVWFKEGAFMQLTWGSFLGKFVTDSGLWLLNQYGQRGYCHPCICPFLCLPRHACENEYMHNFPKWIWMMIIMISLYKLKDFCNHTNVGGLVCKSSCYVPPHNFKYFKSNFSAVENECCCACVC